MKILFDVNFDRGWKRLLGRESPGWVVDTAQDKGWEEKENGDLYRLAEENGYDAIITVDTTFHTQRPREVTKAACVLLRGNHKTKGQTERTLLQRAKAIIGTIESAAAGADITLYLN